MYAATSGFFLLRTLTLKDGKRKKKEWKRKEERKEINTREN
jgi:hypothetical protein